MKNVLVVGVGEIGSALVSLLEDSKKFNVFKKDVSHSEINEKIDIMHICIPSFKTFTDIAVGYINEFKPDLTIINSTAKPGATQEIFKRTKALLVHSPVRGRHPYLKEGMLKFVKFIGPTSKKSAELAKEHFESLGIKTEVLKSPVETEVGKLLETTYYAINIAFHQEMDRICDYYGADFKQAVTRFNQTCTMDIDHKVPRPVMFPGYIGGHCLIPNIMILKGNVKSEFLDAVLKSNELTKKKIGEGRAKYATKESLGI